MFSEKKQKPNNSQNNNHLKRGDFYQMEFSAKLTNNKNMNASFVFWHMKNAE